MNIDEAAIKESLDVVATEAIAWAEVGGDPSAVRFAFERYVLTRGVYMSRFNTLSDFIAERRKCAAEIVAETMSAITDSLQKNISYILYRFANDPPNANGNERNPKLRRRYR